MLAKVLLTNGAVTKWNSVPNEGANGLLINIIIQTEAGGPSIRCFLKTSFCIWWEDRENNLKIFKKFFLIFTLKSFKGDHSFTTLC